MEPTPNQNRNSIRINNSLTESAVSTSSYFTHFSKLYHDEVEKEEEGDEEATKEVAAQGFASSWISGP